MSLHKIKGLTKKLVNPFLFWLRLVQMGAECIYAFLIKKKNLWQRGEQKKELNSMFRVRMIFVSIKCWFF
jgi:hypothetical protein